MKVVWGKLQATDDVLTGYAGKEPIPVTAKFKTKITTSRGALIECWVYIVEGDHNLQPLLGDPESQALGFITFHPEGREPTLDEKNQDNGISEDEDININGISANVKIGEGPMPDAISEPEITEKERKECWEVINRPRYETIFDGHVGTMVKRKPIVLQGDETKRIHSQPYRPVPPQYAEEVSKHLQYLRDNGKILDVDPNTEKVEAYRNLVISRKPNGKLRMNVDARPINTSTADVVSPHMTTPEDVRHRLAGSTRFSEFDMNHGYHQSTLSEDSSRRYGVFQSHEGFHRFTGLYFGHTCYTSI